MKGQGQGGYFHAVRFYEDDKSLCRIASGFVAEGLALNQPALIVAIRPHIDGIVEHLTNAAIDVEQLKKKGDLIVLDAHQTLPSLMANGEPDSDRFKASATAMLEQLTQGRTKTVRAYGEMVDLLWRDGRTASAIKLETLWNHLANTYDFSMLCGYTMGNFYKDATIDEVCRQHTHVISDTGPIALVSSSRTRPTSPTRPT